MNQWTNINIFDVWFDPIEFLY